MFDSIFTDSMTVESFFIMLGGGNSIRIACIIHNVFGSSFIQEILCDQHNHACSYRNNCGFC